MTRSPPRDLGQRFLVDQRGVSLLVSALNGLAGRDFLEVGPGLGALTIEASRLANRILAVEIDAGLAARLTPSLPPNAAVVVGDGVDFVMTTGSEVVFSNSPFYLTSSIVAAAARNNNVRWLVLGCQREVALRLTASPGSRDYGRLSVLAQAYFNVSLIGFIPAGWFRPRPKVDAAVVVMSRRRPWGDEGEALEDLSRCLFSLRNKGLAKVMRRCLPSGVGPPPVRLDQGRRVRDLNPDELVEVSKWLAGLRRGGS